ADLLLSPRTAGIRKQLRAAGFGEQLDRIESEHAAAGARKSPLSGPVLTSSGLSPEEQSALIPPARRAGGLVRGTMAGRVKDQRWGQRRRYALHPREPEPFGFDEVSPSWQQWYNEESQPTDERGRLLRRGYRELWWLARNYLYGGERTTGGGRFPPSHTP